MIEEYIGWLDDDWNTVLDQSQPIVRCKDCKHYYQEMETCLYFDRWQGDSDGFCKWGERFTAIGGDGEAVI